MNYNNLPENLRKRLLLMQQTRITDPAATGMMIKARDKPAKIPTHDWGIFGEYEFLGAGTLYTQKIEAGIVPVNELDRIAMFHDGQYSWSDSNLVGIQKNIFRGGMDYGAGSAMTVSAFNPWSDLTLKDRSLALVAGQGLILQGALRLNPAFWMAGTAADFIFY